MAFAAPSSQIYIDNWRSERQIAGSPPASFLRSASEGGWTQRTLITSKQIVPPNNHCWARADGQECPSYESSYPRSLGTPARARRFTSVHAISYCASGLNWKYDFLRSCESRRSWNRANKKPEPRDSGNCSN